MAAQLVGLRIAQRLYRDGLCRALMSQADISVVGPTESLTELLRVVHAHPIDTALVEVRRGERAAQDAIAAMRQTRRDLRIVVLHELDGYELGRLHRAGADAAADGRDGIDGIIAAVTGVEPREPTTRLTPEPGAEAEVPEVMTLTPREREVLELVATGLTSRLISKCLAVSPKTIENHKQRIFHKLRVQNQGHAVALALRTGLIGAVPTHAVIDLTDAAMRSQALDDDPALIA